MASPAGIDRERVLSAAAEIANRRGLDALTLAELAARLRIKPPSLYNHVAGLEGLRRELKLRALRLLGAAIAHAAIGRSGDPAVHALADAYRGFAKDYPGLYPLVVGALSKQDRETIAASEEIVAVCLAVMSGYGLDRDESIHAIRTIRSLVHGFVVMESAGGFGIPVRVDASFRWAISVFIAGLHALRPGSHSIPKRVQ